MWLRSYTLGAFQQFICQFKYRSWITTNNFGYYLAVIVAFPILFYFPKFFELTTVKTIDDCAALAADADLLADLKVKIISHLTMSQQQQPPANKTAGGPDLTPRMQTLIECIQTFPSVPNTPAKMGNLTR